MRTLESIDTDIARVVKIIAEARSELRNLHYERNAVSSSCRLPTEILEAIFIECVQDYYNSGAASEDCTIPAAPSWVHISYVCRHWRNVALNCPMLWSYLCVVAPRWTEELLARSGETPLKLNLRWYGCHMDAEPPRRRFLELLTEHIGRTEELRLHAIDHSFSDRHFLTVLSSRARRLQKLQIVISVPFWFVPEEFVLFEGDTPSLHALDLSRGSLPWYSLNLSSLTTLTLRHILSPARQNVAEFLTTLRCMPDLTLLHLENALADDFLPLDALQKIGLPRLSPLLVIASPSTVIAFLSCVHIPLNTEVRLGCGRRISSSIDDYAPLCFGLLPRRIHMSEDDTLSSPTICSLSVQNGMGPGHEAVLTLGVSEINHKTDPSEWVVWDCNVPLRVALRFGWFDRSETIDRIVKAFWQSIPLTNIQSISISFYGSRFEDTVAFWAREHALGHLQHLRSLKLHVGEVPHVNLIISWLSSTPLSQDGQDGDGGRGRDRMFAPALEELGLYDILSPEPVAESEIQSLYDILSIRGRLETAQHTLKKDGSFDIMCRWKLVV